MRVVCCAEQVVLVQHGHIFGRALVSDVFNLASEHIRYTLSRPLAPPSSYRWYPALARDVTVACRAKSWRGARWRENACSVAQEHVARPADYFVSSTWQACAAPVIHKLFPHISVPQLLFRAQPSHLATNRFTIHEYCVVTCAFPNAALCDRHTLDTYIELQLSPCPRP